MALPEEKVYTIEDIYDLPEGTRAELIDGQIYYMAPPNTIDQRLVMKISYSIEDYINKKSGSCEVFPAPFAVFIKPHDDRFYVEPDISVICDSDKINKKGCKGAPDWIIEIVSPSNSSYDYVDKLGLYRSTGVREYWIVNPIKKNIFVYFFEETRFNATMYTFEDKVKVNIYEDLYINFIEICKSLNL